MKPLRTEDLNNILTSNPVTKKTYLGTFPSCVFPKTMKKQYSFISNTSDHLDLHGEHWVAWFIDGTTVKFFDSYGRSPSNETFYDYFNDFTLKFENIKYSGHRIQGWNSVACGYFCIHFIYALSLGIDLKTFLKDYSRTKFESNDYNVYEFFHSIL